ncbi:MAG: PAS domain S-box protein [Desulfobacteraceae bacterium]|nr:PAS domain S-box protein [Desulfobacteraceae bacterium]
MPFQKKNTEQDINKTSTLLNILTDRENDVLANEIFDNRLDAINLRLKAILKISEMLKIEVFDDKGLIISSTSESTILEPLSKHEQQSVADDYTTNTSEWENNSILIFTKKISAIGEIIGYIRIYYSINDIREKYRQSLFIFLGLLISILFLMITLLNIILSRTILKPISRLTEITYQIKEKGPGYQVEIKNNDEIGTLSKAFNNMSESLMQSNQQVEEQGKELWNTKNYLDNIINSMPSVLIGVDTKGRVTQWNNKAEETIGIMADKAKGRKLVDVFPRMTLEMKKIIESIETREIRRNQKKPRTSEDGTCYEDITIYPLFNNDVEGAVIRIDDVTEQVQLEEMMVQSEKMLSVGGLAAGMAHEINNPLSGVMQTASVMRKRLNDIEMPANISAAKEIGIDIADIKAFMEKRGILRMAATINEAGQRMATIVSNMLNFARKSDSRTSSHILSELLDNTLELAAADFDLKKQYDFKLIGIKKEYDDNLPMVPCEKAKIQQVLLNILRNGAQAMQEADTDQPMFSIKTKFDTIQKMVCVEIKDNGPGIDKKILKRIFEPFFTTKPAGVGTGLGLSVSYFIITENHGGKLSVESAPGTGTKFIIRLPLGGKKA